MALSTSHTSLTLSLCICGVTMPNTYRSLSTHMARSQQTIPAELRSLPLTFTWSRGNKNHFTTQNTPDLDRSVGLLCLLGSTEIFSFANSARWVCVLVASTTCTSSLPGSFSLWVSIKRFNCAAGREWKCVPPPSAPLPSQGLSTLHFHPWGSIRFLAN